MISKIDENKILYEFYIIFTKCLEVYKEKGIAGEKEMLRYKKWRKLL